MKFSLIMENWRKFLAEEKTTSEQLKPRRGADEVAVDSSGKKIYRTGWAFTDKDPSAPEVYNFKRNPTPEEDYFAWASKQKLSQDQIDYMLGRGRSAPEDLAKDVSKLLISVATMLEPTGQIADVVFHDKEKRMEVITTAEQLSNDVDGLKKSLDRATVHDYGTVEQLKAKVDVFGNAAAVVTGLLAFIPAAGKVISKVKSQGKLRRKATRDIKKATASAEEAAAMIRNLETMRRSRKSIFDHPAVKNQFDNKPGWAYFYKPGELNRDIAKAKKTVDALEKEADQALRGLKHYQKTMASGMDVELVKKLRSLNNSGKGVEYSGVAFRGIQVKNFTELTDQLNIPGIRKRDVEDTWGYNRWNDSPSVLPATKADSHFRDELRKAWDSENWTEIKLPKTDGRITLDTSRHGGTASYTKDFRAAERFSNPREGDFEVMIVSDVKGVDVTATLNKNKIEMDPRHASEKEILPLSNEIEVSRIFVRRSRK